MLIGACASNDIGYYPVDTDTHTPQSNEGFYESVGEPLTDDAPAMISDGGVGDSGTDDEIVFLGAPLIFAPTANGFSVNVALYTGAPESLRLYYRSADSEPWSEALEPVFPAEDMVEWRLEGLEAGTMYQYLISGAEADNIEKTLFRGEAITQRPKESEFTFALLTDSHISPREVGPDLQTWDNVESVLLQTSVDISAALPDFVIHLGDVLDFHLFGFNDPPPDGLYTRLGYLNYRRLLVDTMGYTSHFMTIGNWEGENGCYTEEERARSLEQRLLYMPGPTPDTYPEGGSVDQDYYAFTWGDALFIVLNVMGYTPTWHLLSTYPGLPDDWTLGEEQFSWFRKTLEQATSKWRFIFIHHTVGGNAGDDSNSGYGRGGGRAAYVGEQELVHKLMLEHGVQIFFYGHDHVFTDMVVDGIHYTLPGSAGAPWKFSSGTTGYEPDSYWSHSGHGHVTVSPTTVKVDFIALGGEVLHSYTIEDDAPPLPPPIEPTSAGVRQQ
jgi:3',5'-cyclic AMP phosphodiesterase CpdA